MLGFHSLAGASQALIAAKCLAQKLSKFFLEQTHPGNPGPINAISASLRTFPQHIGRFRIWDAHQKSSYPKEALHLAEEAQRNKQ